MCSSRCALAFTALLVLIASGGLPLGVEGGKYDHLFQLNYELPKFLAGAPDAVKAEHQAMWDNGVKTMTEKALIKVEAEWVAKQSPEIQAKFAEFNKQEQQIEKRTESGHEGVVKKLSPEGHAAANKLAEFGHKKLPMADEVRQMRAFFDSLPPAIQAEVGDDLLKDDAQENEEKTVVVVRARRRTTSKIQTQQKMKAKQAAPTGAKPTN